MTARAAWTLLDGAVGTELSRRQVDTRHPLWSARALVEAPSVVRDIHAESALAGCDVLTTCTFRTGERTLARAGWSGRSSELNRVAVGLAQDAVARTRDAVRAAGRLSVRVAGGLAPLEDCFRPDLVPGPDALAREHAAQASSLAGAGADLLLVETMISRAEAIAAVRGCVATGLPTWCSFLTSAPGRLLSGESLADAVAAVEDLGAEAVLLNCIPAVEAMADFEALARVAHVPTGVYPNIGHGRGTEGWRQELMLTPEQFAQCLADLRAAGASILGGCCGTEPRHLSAAR